MDTIQLTLPMLLKKIWNNKKYQVHFSLYVLINTLIFIWFKSYYPFPNFAAESVAYFDTSPTVTLGTNWSSGYYKFLNTFEIISRNHILLVYFQYLSIHLSVLFLIATICYFLNKDKWIIISLLIIPILLNPVFLNIGNLITADALFISISTILFTCIIWSMYRPTLTTTYLIIIFIFLAYIFNQNSIWYYPIIIIIALNSSFLRKKKVYHLLIMIFIPILSIIVFKALPISKKEVILTPKEGWQQASNALYAYYYAPKLLPESVPDEYRRLLTITNQRMDSLKNVGFIRPDSILGEYYLLNENSPLRIYLNEILPKYENIHYIDLRNHIKKLYYNFSKIIISKNFKEYRKYYLEMNTIFYLTPLSEDLTWYNRGYDTINNNAKNWFRLSSNKLYSWNNSASIPYNRRELPITFGIIKTLFFLSCISFLIIIKKHEMKSLFSKIVYFSLLVFFINLIFTVLNSPINLRGQAFIVIFFAIIGMSIIRVIIKKSFKSTNDSDLNTSCKTSLDSQTKVV